MEYSGRCFCKVVRYLFVDTFKADICPINMCYRQLLVRFQCCSVYTDMKGCYVYMLKTTINFILIAYIILEVLIEM